MMFVNGEPTDTISALDRGLSYGDGLFETIRFVGTVAPLWHRHMRRLHDGCLRLQLPPPDLDALWREAVQVTIGHSQSIVRITLTRGRGERGYAPPIPILPTRIVTAFAMVPLPAGNYARGIRVQLCRTRLGDQPLLAGIKHLNRLEQVLARAEWSDPAIGEGLMRDQHGHIIAATSANLFAVVGGVIVTPALDRCGIAGVARAELLDCLAGTQVRDLPLDECLAASELFLSSSVRGILPVQAVDDTVYGPGPVARAMQAHWRELGFSLEQA